jgi:hypothetical protein
MDAARVYLDEVECLDAPAHLPLERRETAGDGLAGGKRAHRITNGTARKALATAATSSAAALGPSPVGNTSVTCAGISDACGS